MVTGGLVAVVVGALVLGRAGTWTSPPTVAAPERMEVATTNGAEQPDVLAPATVFPGQLEGDLVVQSGGAATIEGWQITVSPLELRENLLGLDAVCADVTLVNRSDQAEGYDVLAFQLHDPAGGVQEYGTIGTAEEKLSSGRVPPGGQVTGEQCFESRDAGRYVLLYQPSAVAVDGGRVAFVGTV
jgi:hypothetical protein